MGEYRITRAWSNMRLVTFLTLFVTISLANAQFFNAIRNLFSPVTNLFNGGGRFVDDGLSLRRPLVVKNCFRVIVDEIRTRERGNSASLMVFSAKNELTRGESRDSMASR